MCFFYPVFRKFNDKFNLALFIFRTAGRSIQDFKTLPDRLFSPGARRLLIIIGPVVGMQRGVNIFDFLFDLGTVAGAHELFRSLGRTLAFYYLQTTFFVSDI